MIKEDLLLPYVDLKTEYYDLGLQERDRTNDQVTIEAANAALRLGVAVKCATITPNADRVREYGLKQMWKSPNGTIRAIMDGTVFRCPIIVRGIEPNVRTWKKPITIARHAYGDVYKNSEIIVPGKGRAELVFTAHDGSIIREPIHIFDGPGILQGWHNMDRSIESFAKSCFEYALDKPGRICGLPRRIPSPRNMTRRSGRSLIVSSNRNPTKTGSRGRDHPVFLYAD